MPVTFGSDRPLLPWKRITIIYDFQHKIVYNLACARDTAQMFARSSDGQYRSVQSWSANLMVSLKLCSDDPCCYGNKNLGTSTVN